MLELFVQSFLLDPPSPLTWSPQQQQSASGPLLQTALKEMEKILAACNITVPIPREIHLMK